MSLSAPHSWEPGTEVNFFLCHRTLKPPGDNKQFIPQAIALDRALHQVRYFARPVENSQDQTNPGKIQKEMVKKLFEDVLLHNANSGRNGKHPATYETILR